MVACLTSDTLPTMQELMSAISSRIPPSVEEAIQSCLARYASNLTSVLCQFPSQQVCVCCVCGVCGVCGVYVLCERSHDS